MKITIVTKVVAMNHTINHTMNITIVTKVVASEQSEWWLSVHDILHFLPHNDPTQVRNELTQEENP